MRATKNLIESFDLTWGGIENLPHDHWEQILLGGVGRDEQMANVTQTMENMSRVGVPILGYCFSIASVTGHWRNYDGGGRGGANLKSFDVERIPDNSTHPSGPVSVEQMWQRLKWFLDHAVPVAERIGVKLAAHQDDPPMEVLQGTGRMMTNHDAMQCLLDYAPSPCNGLEFCQGTVAEMGTATVIGAIRRFGGQGKIFYVHFRNIVGQFPRFDEVFLDEGDVSPHAAIRAYHEVGFDGVMTPDHCPVIEGEEGYRHRGMAFSLGYIRALMQMVDPPERWR